MSHEWELRLAEGAARPNRPDRIVLSAPVTLIGRDPNTVDVCLDSQTFSGLISRLHARIRIDESCRLMIEDVSLNGCSVDGQRITRTPTEIKENSRVVFGIKGSATEFVYVAARRTPRARGF